MLLQFIAYWTIEVLFVGGSKNISLGGGFFAAICLKKLHITINDSRVNLSADGNNDRENITTNMKVRQ